MFCFMLSIIIIYYRRLPLSRNSISNRHPECDVVFAAPAAEESYSLRSSLKVLHHNCLGYIKRWFHKDAISGGISLLFCIYVYEFLVLQMLCNCIPLDVYTFLFCCNSFRTKVAKHRTEQTFQKRKTFV